MYGKKEVGSIPKGCQIHHINGNKADNRLDNLAIMTASGHQRLHSQEQSRKDLYKKAIERARPAAIEWHKSKEGREWHKQHYNPNALHQRIKLKCQQCGKEFEGLKFQKFCSNACKAKFRRNSGIDDVERVCAVCGKSFMTTRFKKQKYCSMDCQHKAHVGWYERRKGQS